MKILWITWKDSGHPEAGGAERVCAELCTRLVDEGHVVTLLTTTYPNAKPASTPQGIPTIRIGSNRYTHPFQALWYFIRRLRNTYDVVIEEVNGGAPYFSVFFSKKSKRFLLYHQLGRRNWLYEITRPFSYIGYHVLVPLATRLVSLANVPVITVSDSTREVLHQFGLNRERTHIISEGLHIEPLSSLKEASKFSSPTLLSHGSMRAMKRTIDQIKAFEIAKKKMPDLRLKISGSNGGIYGKKVMNYIARSPYKKDIEYLGRTTDNEKISLMRKCHAILVTSVEEGWGLIVSEANSQGTPAVVYEVDGLRDSVRTDTGIRTAENPEALAEGIVQLFTHPIAYEKMRRRGWEWSKTLTFNQGHQDLKKILEIA